MKYLKLLIALYGIAAIAVLLEDNSYLRDRLDELTDKYWEGNRQIALYSDEVTKLRKKAKWEPVRDVRNRAIFYYCPICSNIETIKANYCSRCGADMREGSNE